MKIEAAIKVPTQPERRQKNTPGRRVYSVLTDVLETDLQPNPQKRYDQMDFIRSISHYFMLLPLQ